MNTTLEKQGYKYTEEFGYIPEDWEVNDLEYACIDMLQGVNTAIDIPEYVSSGIPMLKANNIIGGKLKINEADNISLDTYLKYSERFKIKQFDFLFSNIGARLGTGSLMTKNIDCSFAWNVMRMIPNYARISPKYLAIFMNSDLLYNQIKQTESGSGMGFIPKNILKNLNIVLPPIPEQKKIAEVMGDVDSLIDKTQQLINKKKDLKTATMQKLLTPKDDWEKYIIGQMGSTYSGLSGKNKDAFGNGESLYIPFLNIMNNPVIDTKTLEKVCINTNESQNLCLKDDLFFNTSSETPEEVGMCATLQEEISNLYLNSFCFGYRLKQNINVIPKFLVYLFRGQYGRKIMQTLAQGSTRYNLPKDKFMEYEVVLPKFEEQKRTVAILSDMDSEIETLEKKLNKYKDLKTGMMQQLLTGKVRLI